MLRLILMRHAKSDWSHAGISDHERPLNARGRAAALALGGWLRSNSYGVDQVLCSTATRTRETLECLALDPSPETGFTRSLYLAEARAMMETLHTAKFPRVLMLGHNPGICEMAHRLLDDPPTHRRFEDYPTGATLVCDFDAADWDMINWHDGRIVDFIVPRDLTD